MKRVCAWCQADLGEVESKANPENAITHGICCSCAARLRSTRGEPLQDFLNRLGVPVLLVESEPRVMTANEPARKLLGKCLGEIEGRRGGELIECVHASQFDGCSQPTHCKTCKIRNTVLETFETGRSFLHVQTFPDIQVGQEVKKMSLEISTEKVRDVVLLRIDNFGDTD